MIEAFSQTRTRLFHAALALVCVVVAGGIGNLATLPNIPTWYAGLVKPAFNPPNWIFGPVWTVLYLMMALSLYRLLRRADSQPKIAAIIVFLVQLAFNAAWSVAFFGLHSPALGLIVIVVLWALIALTIKMALPLDRLAGYLLLPYLLWVSFAMVLNIAILVLN